MANLTYRLPKGISTAKGRSVCDHCGTPLSWHDNIPLFSFLVLGGRSRCCSKPISKRYFWIELASGMLFVIFGWLVFAGNLSLATLLTVPRSVSAVVVLAAVSCMLAVFVTDWEHQIIPDEIVFALAGVICVFLILYAPELLYTNLFAGLVSGLFFLTLVAVTKGKGMGMGDVKLAVSGGLLLGLASITWIFVSFVLGAVVGLGMIALGKAKLGKHIAFGPFMVIAFLLTIIYGNFTWFI